MDADTLVDIHTSLETGLIVYPHFEQSDAASMNNLKQTIISAIETYNNKKKNKKPDPNSPEGQVGKAIDAMAQTAEQMRKDREKVVKEERKRALEEKKKQEREKSFENKFKQIQEELADHFTAGQKLAFRLASETIKQTIKFGVTLYKTQAEHTAKLSIAGITSNKSVVVELKNLVRETGMTRESIVSYLSGNSDVMTRLRRFGSNALEKSSSALAGANAVSGMTHSEVMSATSLYLQNITEFNNAFGMSTDDIYTSSQKAAESLKLLSLATGKSVEQITQEIKAREKTLLNKRLGSDNKTKDMYNYLTAMGFDDDIIHFILTGKPSEKAARTMATPEGKRLLLSMRQLQMTSGGNADAIRSGISELANSSLFYQYQQRFKNVNPTLLAMDNGLHESLYGLEGLKQFNEIVMNEKDALRIDAIKRHEEAITRFTDVLKNPNVNLEVLDKITIFIGKLGNMFAEWTEKHPMITGVMTVVSQIPSSILLIGLLTKSIIAGIGLVSLKIAGFTILLGNLGNCFEEAFYNFFDWIINDIPLWFEGVILKLRRKIHEIPLIGSSIVNGVKLIKDEKEYQQKYQRYMKTSQTMDAQDGVFETYVPGVVTDRGTISSGFIGELYNDLFGKTQNSNTTNTTTNNTTNTTTSPSPTLNVSSTDDTNNLLKTACDLLSKIVNNTEKSSQYVASTSYS